MRSERFADRTAAGRDLGDLVAGVAGLHLDGGPLVLGLARGGVVVAAEVARALDGDLDVLVVRKVGHPRRPELGMGALAEDGVPVLDDAGLAAYGLTRADLEPVVASERDECRRRVAAYRGDRPGADVAGRTVVVVDDGVATGGTARAALRSVRRRGPDRLVLATPVVAPSVLADLEQDADEVLALVVPPHLGAVSQWYDRFGQTGDDEVVRLLATARRSR